MRCSYRKDAFCPQLGNVFHVSRVLLVLTCAVRGCPARDVRLVGWDVGVGYGEVDRAWRGEGIQGVIISCEGRWSREESSASSPQRGIWLSGEYITQLANLTVTGKGPVSCFRCVEQP